MGIKDVRDAFSQAGAGKFTCTNARLRYAQDGNNSQILEFDGQHADGTPFTVTSEPFDQHTKPQEMAAQMGRKLAAQPTGQSAGPFQQPQSRQPVA